MPLPPAPAKRAALLAPEAYDAPARTPPRAARKPEARADHPSQAEQPRAIALDLLDDRTGGAPDAAAQTTALLDDLQSRCAAREPATPRHKGPMAPVAQAAPRPKRKSSGPAKLFVLDTNVLMHDPMSLFRFEEHDIFLPMIVLEELDGHKKGMTEVARNARQASRTLDALAGAQGADIASGLRLDTTGHREAGGKLFFQTQALVSTLPSSLPQGKADNQILGVVDALRQQHAPRTEGGGVHPTGHEVVLVSKDINMRVKARALGLATDDYQNDKTLEDGDLLYSGAMALPPDFWARHGKTIESWQSGSHTFYRISGPVVPNLLINQFVYFEAPGEPSLYARVTEIRAKTAVLKTLKDFGHLKNAVWGVTTRNREQNFAMPSCSASLSPIAKFCHRCGKAAGGAARAVPAVKESRVPWLVAGFLVIAGLTYIAYQGINRNSAPDVARMANAGNAAPGGQPVDAGEAEPALPAGTPPDISSMSASERFNRLFDRVMRAASAGDTAQARQFTPMAILAYGMLDTVTTDLRYHAAVLYAESGQDAAALALADTILAQSPNHLFGYLVRGEVADRRRDAAAAAAARKDFTAHYQAEIGRADRPEYGEHKPVIDEYRNSVNGKQ